MLDVFWMFDVQKVTSAGVDLVENSSGAYNP